MKIVFEKKQEGAKDVPVPEPVESEEAFKPHSERKVVSIRSQPGQKVPSPPPAPANEEIEQFKNKYMGVFGMDSITASSGEVLQLNLLFAIYSELVGLRQDLQNGGE